MIKSYNLGLFRCKKTIPSFPLINFLSKWTVGEFSSLDNDFTINVSTATVQIYNQWHGALFPATLATANM